MGRPSRPLGLHRPNDHPRRTRRIPETYSGNPNPSLVLQDLGVEYLITRTGIKPHACCRYKQGPIDCLI